MGKGDLTYEELKARHDELQRQAARSLIIGQNLVNAKDHLDRDLNRFKTIQKYSERVIQATDIDAFYQITIESIIEAFEVECSAILIFDKKQNGLKATAAFGFETLKTGHVLDIEGIETRDYLKRKSAFIEDLESDTHPWKELDLCQMILCPYNGNEGELRGFVLGGRGNKNQAFYEELTREIIPSFTVFSQQMQTLLLNFESKEHLDRIIQERTEKLKVTNLELTKINEELEQEIGVRKRTEEKLRTAEKEATELSTFLKKMFGRYLPHEVMESLLENPLSLELGGERREVTIMMSDLRGFTSITERLEPEQVVNLLNTYFEVMVDLIRKYGGTINEIIGDSLLIIFGAPQKIPDRTKQAIACAIEMQNAMAVVNQMNRSNGLPDIEMGIALHDSEVVVGNIGSKKRIKYSVVGSGVNIASRIESYTVGGQILISGSVLKSAGDILRIDGHREVIPKGYEKPLKIYEIGGIAGKYNVALDEKNAALVALAQKIPLAYKKLEGKHIGNKSLGGFVVSLSRKAAEMILDGQVKQFNNIKMNLKDVYEELAAKDFYGKVIDASKDGGNRYIIRFTSLPPEIVSYFLAHLQYATKE